MADFKAALKEGFAAANRADNARREINEVLEKLRSDILEASGGKLRVELGEFQERIPLSPIERMAGVQGLGVPEIRTYRALGVTNADITTGPKKRELARWNQGRFGYPCTLTWNNEERQCQDRIALEDCLADLLKDPATGQTLNSMSSTK